MIVDYQEGVLALLNYIYYDYFLGYLQLVARDSEIPHMTHSYQFMTGKYDFLRLRRRVTELPT